MAHTIDELVALMDAANPFGPLHVAIDDGNMDDRSIGYCEEEMGRREATDADRACLVALKAATEEDRRAAYTKLHGDQT